MENAITYHKHSEIDKAKWDALIKAAPNGLAYAQSDFLDAMSPQWDALIAGDYHAVMPLTWRKKMGIRYLCQPAFCQQLGIFSAAPIHPPLVESFLRKATVNFRLVEIFLNETNHSENMQQAATNFVLPLNKPYETIREQYRNDLIKNLKRTEKFTLHYRASDDTDDAINQYEILYGKKLGYRPGDFDALRKICRNWVKQGKCIVREVILKDKMLTQQMAIGLFLKDDRRLYNIASTTLPNGRTLEANHFLFDQLIREFAGQNILLDFEGSDLPGVARFYQKFSPENRPYFFWKSNRLPAVLRWWKR
ncbi:MAG: hypothetical protein MUE99_07550 [Chitinophagaceae bacterium]|nr:hypothetical protein [Chitinophagaceae bacterium]